MTIPVAQPLLPHLTEIKDLLQEMNVNRWYSNGGPLVVRFERALCEHLGAPEGGVASLANGTLGLTVALMALGAPAGSLCLMPSWTFVATPLAALNAGLRPYFVDVDRDSWMLTPDMAQAAIAAAPGPVGAIIPVAPFGQTMAGPPWDALTATTGVPVLIDAAAAIDTWRPTRAPAMISLHATKLLGVGEGGIVVSTDPAFIADIRQRSNFGFRGSRDAGVVALNAKMSELHAAIGLAALRGLPATRRAFMDVAQAYGCRLTGNNQIQLMPGFGESWISTTFNIVTPNHCAAHVARTLLRSGVETRAWWGHGAHRQTALTHLPRTDLPNTDWLARRTLGLPFSVDLSKSNVDHVCDVLESALDEEAHDALNA